MEKKKMRFYAALISAKTVRVLLRGLGRNATHAPGAVALKICPDFLQSIEKPKQTVFITGTNGKTTVSNLISSVLVEQGHTFVHNPAGSNILAGIITALIQKSTLSGKPKCTLAVLEADERVAPLLYPHFPPDYLVCTNLFRDSYRRNAHAQFIWEILHQYIPQKTRLILNGDDLMASQLGDGHQNCYFGVQCYEQFPSSDNIIKDVMPCPRCGSVLVYDQIRYHHIGRAHCSQCSFQSPNLDYLINAIDEEKETCDVQTSKGSFQLHLIGHNMTDVYNSIAAVAVLLELGLEIKDIQAAFEKTHIVASRFNSQTVNHQTFILLLAKGQNPVAVSRVCDFIAHEPGRKMVICLLDDAFDAKKSSENIAWIHDADFEFLNDDSILQVIYLGCRCQDYHLRFLMAGIPEKKIVCQKSMQLNTKEIAIQAADRIYILHDITTYSQAKKIYQKLLADASGKTKREKWENEN